jgi:nitrile hydratase accessory protein
LSQLEPEAPFHAPWEAEAFAMTVKLNEAGHFTWGEWAETLGAEIKAAPHRPYYESWLAALEVIVERKGLMRQSERLQRIDAWDRAAHATPHGQPILLENAMPSFAFKTN